MTDYNYYYYYTGTDYPHSKKKIRACQHELLTCLMPAGVTASIFIHTSMTNGIIYSFQILFGFGKTACIVSTPFQLPKLLDLLGRQHEVASAVQEILQFECNKLHIKKGNQAQFGQGSFGDIFPTQISELHHS